MLHSHMDALLEDAVSNALVDLNSQRSLGHVPHTAGLSVVEFVGHTLLDGSITNHVHDLAKLVCLCVFRELDQPILTKPLFEHITGGGPVPKGVGHLPKKMLGHATTTRTSQ